MFEGNHRLSKAEGLGTGTYPAPSDESPPYAQEVYGGGNSPLLKITPGNVPEEIDGTPNSVPSGSPEIHFYANSVQASYNDDESIPIDTVSSSIENSVDVNTTGRTSCTSTFINSDKYYFSDNQSSTSDPKVTNPRSKAFDFAGLLSSSFSSDPSVIVNGSDALYFSFGTTPTWCDSFTTTVSPHDSVLGLPIWADTDTPESNTRTDFGNRQTDRSFSLFHGRECSPLFRKRCYTNAGSAILSSNSKSPCLPC